MILDNREKLDLLVQQACEVANVELVELDIFQAGNRKIVRLFIDCEGGVTVDHCAKCSRTLGDSLELEDIFPEAFTLEVSSPGLDRPLKSTRDFERNLGRLLRVTLGKGKPVSGILNAVDEEALVLKVKGSSEDLRLVRAEILTAKVDVQI